MINEAQPRPRVAIEYCRQCRFILRAGWLAQELLFSLGDELGEVALVPSEGGIFAVHVDSRRVFARSEAERFPEAKELKQLVRDHVAPERELGHSDDKGDSNGS